MIYEMIAAGLAGVGHELTHESKHYDEVVGLVWLVGGILHVWCIVFYCKIARYYGVDIQ